MLIIDIYTIYFIEINENCGNFIVCLILLYIIMWLLSNLFKFKLNLKSILLFHELGGNHLRNYTLKNKECLPFENSIHTWSDCCFHFLSLIV